jgi:hypothetical protein
MAYTSMTSVPLSHFYAIATPDVSWRRKPSGSDQLLPGRLALSRAWDAPKTAGYLHCFCERSADFTCGGERIRTSGTLTSTAVFKTTSRIKRPSRLCTWTATRAYPSIRNVRLRTQSIAERPHAPLGPRGVPEAPPAAVPNAHRPPSSHGGFVQTPLRNGQTRRSEVSTTTRRPSRKGLWLACL